MIKNLGFEMVTEQKDINEINSFTIARVMGNTNGQNHCVELHYNKGEIWVEIGTKQEDNSWEDIIKSVEWYNKKLSTEEIFKKLEEIFYEYFGDWRN